MTSKYKHKYLKYKAKYLQFKGGKIADEKVISFIPSTYHLTLNGLLNADQDKKDIQLDKTKNILFLCELNVIKCLVIGDTDYSILPNMKTGIYKVYLADDNLVVVHESKSFDLDIFRSLIFKSSGGVGVDSGTFGFFDGGIFSEIADKKPIKKKFDNDIPYAEFDIKKLEKYKYLSMTANQYTDDKEIIKKYLGIVGVITSTISGDGGFDCYISDDNVAILIGAITQCKIDGGKDKDCAW